MPPLGLTHILFVDQNAVGSTQDGSLANPYLSIQAAVDAVPIPATVADSANDWMILIAPGDYDEPLSIKGPVRLALIGLGAFRLGRYTVKGPTQTNIVAKGGATPRNLVWYYDNVHVISGGAAPQLVIGMIAGTDVVRHGKPIANRISGSIIVQGTAVGEAQGGTAFLAIANTQVDAGITKSQSTPTQPAVDATGFSGILVDRHFNSRFRGEILGPLNGVPETAPAYVLAASFMSQYEQLVQVSRYGSIEQAAFAGGMTVSQVPSLFKSGVPPGMVNSTFAEKFTFKADAQFEPDPQNPPLRDGAGSLLLDSATNTWFIRNGAKLAGGATKSFLGGASQTLYIEGAKTLTDSECGVTLLANTTPDSYTVTLPSAVGKDDLTFTLKNTGTEGRVQVMPVDNQLIDGKAVFFLLPPGYPGQTSSGIKIVAHGGNWWIVAHVASRILP